MSSRTTLTEYLLRADNTNELTTAGDDGAAVPIPQKLYRMSEVAEHLGLTRQTLHNYVTIGLITEERQTRGGQRLFSESVFWRLALIQRLKRKHSLRDIRRILEQTTVPHAGPGPSESQSPSQPRTMASAGRTGAPAAATTGANLPPASAGERSEADRLRELLAAAHLADAAPTPPAEARHTGPQPAVDARLAAGHSQIAAPAGPREQSPADSCLPAGANLTAVPPTPADQPDERRSPSPTHDKGQP